MLRCKKRHIFCLPAELIIDTRLLQKANNQFAPETAKFAFNLFRESMTNNQLTQANLLTASATSLPIGIC